MSNPVVVLTDQVFPDVATERAIPAEARPLDYPVAAEGEVRQADR